MGANWEGWLPSLLAEPPGLPDCCLFKQPRWNHQSSWVSQRGANEHAEGAEKQEGMKEVQSLKEKYRRDRREEEPDVFVVSTFWETARNISLEQPSLSPMIFF